MRDVLVACPTFDGKNDAFPRWVERVKNLLYPRYDIFVSDNSLTPDNAARWSSQIPIEHLSLPADMHPHHRICASMAAIQKRFLAGPYKYWMNIEADVIPPANVIEVMLWYGSGADWTSHNYPATQSCRTCMIHGIGCSLLSRRLIEAFDWSRALDSPDIALDEWIKARGGYRIIELRGFMEVEHLHR